MSLYNKASLVLIPSGTKAGTVYSQKPTDGDGDFDFTRSSYATRVNSKGLIEKERSNLLLQSNNFDTTWEQFNASLTPNQTGYDGSSDAWLLSTTTNSPQIRQYGLTLSGVHTFSVYLKAGTNDWARLLVQGGVVRARYFDLANGVTGGSEYDDEIDSSMVDVGGGWYRCSITVNISNITNARVLTSNADLNHLNTTSGNIYIQDAQLEQGLVATDVIETTTSAVYEGITDNVPRLDYDGDCPSLLLEPQRSNKVGNSEFINDDSSWTEQNGADCTPNYAISPEGIQNATRIQLDNSGANSLTRIFHDFTPDSSNDTASFYAKSNTGSSLDITFYLRDSGFGTVRGNKTVTLTSEWQRFELTADCSGASGDVMFLIYNTTASENWDFLLYAPQVEEGSYATSYIPTYGTSVTRIGDVCNNAGDSTIFNDSEGVLFVETSKETTTIDGGISVSDGTYNNRVLFYFDTSGNIRGYVYSSGEQANIITSGLDYTQNNKLAIKYSANSTKFFVNGSLVGTEDTSSTMPVGLNQINLHDGGGGSDFYGNVKSILYFDRALTDEELADLTT